MIIFRYIDLESTDDRFLFRHFAVWLDRRVTVRARDFQEDV